MALGVHVLNLEEYYYAIHTIHAYVYIYYTYIYIYIHIYIYIYISEVSEGPQLRRGAHFIVDYVKVSGLGIA